jgi:hypothetical protein
MMSAVSNKGGASCRWQAFASYELAKLTNRDSDWKLNGTSSSTMSRTRHAGKGRPNLVKKVVNEESDSDVEMVDSEDSNGDEEYIFEEEDDSGDDFMDLSFDEESGGPDDAMPTEKPPPTRVIMEVKMLTKAFDDHCRCPQCGGSLELEVKSIVIATSLTLTCMTSNCPYVYHGDSPAATSVSKKKESCNEDDSRERSTDYAINVLYIAGLVSCGDGGTEAGRVLGLLGLPNDTTMEKKSFCLIEDRICGHIKKLSEQILIENLVEEVRITMEKSGTLDDNDFMLWKQALDGSIVLSKSKYPALRVSYDMAWQQRSSGKKYNSPSGHALFVGGYTRKPISMIIKSKLCSYCKNWKQRKPGEAVPPHCCFMNYEGSSGAMEPLACLDMTIELYRNKHCKIGLICADDDASTRSMLRWSNSDYMKNNNTTVYPTEEISKGPNKGKLQKRKDRGRLPADVHEPMFVADPGHRKKVLTGVLQKMLDSKVDERATLSRMDATRIGKNFGYMIRSLPRLQECKYVDAAQAVLEHHFDNHQHCGPWCNRSRVAEADRSKRFYRNKEQSGKLYAILQEKLGRFMTLDRLKEVAHGMDTQVNESFNNTAAWMAPKNKVYCGTGSLCNRLSMAVGISSVGFAAYFERLYKVLGITITPNVTYFLNCKDIVRKKRLAKIRTKEQKKLRLKRKHEQLRKDEVQTRKSILGKDAFYKSGTNMDDVVEHPQETAARNKKAPAVCPHCKKKGHKTTKSKRCLFHNKEAAAPAVPAPTD